MTAPWAATRRTVVLVAVALAALPAACSGNGSHGPSAKAYAAGAGDSCIRAKQRVVDVSQKATAALGPGDPFDPASTAEARIKAAPFEQQLADVYRDLHDQLAALKAPAAEQADLGTAVSNIGQVASDLMRAANALRTGAVVDHVIVFPPLERAGKALRASGAAQCSPEA